MNYISHHEVARQYDPEASPTFLFSSFVSDFARMSGTRTQMNAITNPDAPDDVVRGMRLHRLTNNPAFDEQPMIKVMNAELKQAFAELVPVRTARQAANVSQDLLFDGVQFRRPGVVSAFETTLGHVLSGEADLGVALPKSMAELVEQIHTEGPPRYDDAEVVALRLRTVLSKTRTPLLAQHGQVVEVLERFQPGLFIRADWIMQQTVETLREVM